MYAVSETGARELDNRNNDGIDVTLLWSPADEPHLDGGCRRQCVSVTCLHEIAVEEANDAALVFLRLITDAADVLGGRHLPDLLGAAGER